MNKNMLKKKSTSRTIEMEQYMLSEIELNTWHDLMLIFIIIANEVYIGISLDTKWETVYDQNNLVL